MLDLGRFLSMDATMFKLWCADGCKMPSDAVEVVMTAGPATDAIAAGAPLAIGRDGIAVVEVLGMTNKRYRSRMTFSGIEGLASYIGTTWAVQAAVADPKVKVVVLKIDSPGGYVDGVAEAADDIARAAKSKRVIAQIDGLGASAAYWMASQASEVYAGELDKVGNMGVMSVLYDLSGQAKAEGIEPVVFATGTHKWTGVPGTKITDEQRAHVQGLVDHAGSVFVSDVARGRRRSEADIRKVADGRVFVGEDAIKAGLIDGVSSYAETMTRLRGELAATELRDSRMRAARLDAAAMVSRKF